MPPPDRGWHHFTLAEDEGHDGLRIDKGKKMTAKHAAIIAALESGQAVPGWDPDNSDRIADASPPTKTVAVVYWDVYERHTFGPWRHANTISHVIEWAGHVATLRERGLSEGVPWAGHPGKILGKGMLPESPDYESAYLAVEKRLVEAHGLTLDRVIVLVTP